jgi:hypothetical protein
LLRCTKTARFPALPAALVARPVKPEASTNLSAGIVLNPSADLTVTLDAYQIGIRDRIVGSGSLYGSGGSVNSPADPGAILANGNVLDPTVVQTGVNIFSNAAWARCGRPATGPSTCARPTMANRPRWVRPTAPCTTRRRSGTMSPPTSSPFGVNGGYYYVRAGLKF